MNAAFAVAVPDLIQFHAYILHPLFHDAQLLKCSILTIFLSMIICTDDACLRINLFNAIVNLVLASTGILSLEGEVK